MNFDTYVSRLQRLYSDLNLELELAAPAGDRELEKLQAVVEIEIPDDMIQCWKRSNGSESYPFFGHPHLVIPYEFLTVNQAISAYQGLESRAVNYEALGLERASDPRIKDGWFHRGWLPFAEFVGGDILICDLAPESGKRGQVIGFSHDPDDIVFIAASLPELLDLSLAALEEEQDQFFEDYL